MTRPAAIAQIQEACKQIALQFMKIHPALGKLEDAETQSDALKSMHEMTVHLEIIKKKLIKLQQRDDSAEL
jgi:thymidylate synthase ThyX